MANELYSAIVLSGSTDGQPIQVAATGTPGTVVHAASASPTIDLVWLWASNVTGSDVILTVEFGTAGAAFEVDQKITANDNELVLAGVPLTNSKTVKVYAASGSAINVY